MCNQFEKSKPIYGGILSCAYWLVTNFDGHSKSCWGPATLPIFNQLVMFDINYKETVLETIVGDLAESWEISSDNTEITFKLRQGVKWHDGVPFTSDDVIYSLEKMTDVNRSDISGLFPAYASAEKINDHMVKVRLKYASAGFMLALAQGESQIQALHLAGTDRQSAAFMVGTGPFILKEYLPKVHIKYKRNPDYWKKDIYGNQLPYLDGMIYYHASWKSAIEMMVGRQLDLLGVMTGAATTDTYEYLKNGAPELLWQRRDRYNGAVIFINTTHKPLNDIRVRRAMAMVLDEEKLIIGYSGDVLFGLPGAGILHPTFGLPKEEVANLMGWDKPHEQRIAEAHKLMTEAGYQDGFKLNMLPSDAGTMTTTGVTKVFADALRQYLKIDVEVSSGLGSDETHKRMEKGNYDTYTSTRELSDTNQLSTYFGTEGKLNYSKYTNLELDKMLAGLDQILDPEKRREAIWAIERILLTDLPALPTGSFVPNFMPYYPHVKNLRWNYNSYSNICRLEDIWIDESLRPK